MHISEGILSAPVLLSGGVLTVAGTALGLKQMDYDQVARVGILSASFFVASLIHVPIGPSNVHLIMNGLVGLMLGWTAFPAILVALLLQGVLFQFGGITTLGVNTIIMALPAICCHYIFRGFIGKDGWIAHGSAFACGALSVLGGALIVALALMLTEENFFEIAALIAGAHVPVMVIEGIITAFCISFLKKVQPELLPGNLK